MEVSVEYHSILIYGAEFGANGNAVHYYIKDSYPDYFYFGEAARTHERIWELTTAVR